MKTKNKIAIQELLGRSAYYFDMHDISKLESCFAEDANMLVNIADGQTFGPFEGRKAIMELMSGTLATQTDTPPYPAATGPLFTRLISPHNKRKVLRENPRSPEIPDYGCFGRRGRVLP